MAYGICNLPIVPVRATVGNKSEMVTQLLFGEGFEVLDRLDDYLYIKLAYDDYEGWIDSKQQVEIDSRQFQILKDEVQPIADLSTHAMLLKLGKDESLHLLPGSTLPFLEDDSFKINDTEYLFLGLSRDPDTDDFKKEVEEVLRFYLNTPYLWGGRSVFGIDCSGFVQMVYKHFGVRLKRDAYQQAKEGRVVDFLQEASLGDIAFFDDDEGRIVHVGILLNESEIIHASGRVKIEKIDNTGIFSEEHHQYTHKLRIVKRIIT
ncbi:C40 family peptidase [Olivibacter sp. SDN3]|uniref:C40 family peptidase n=1 Tax=Olivibacter sp. SDN3 TaxID=2764720 RepID=UPI0016512493|nr:C40 family peptidase [Olivibacter sp. SDN3]QNL49095.1 C40 family peptidase [Olivibacter sp. SDN3]